MKKFKWTVEFTIDETWVADGFDLTSERAHDMICNELSSAYSHEVKARTISAPPAKDIATAQGFKSVAAMRAAS